ncbi:hypothetical protein K2Z84_14375 [Candidatus Binatia bacterium]|nr:hypothetical protein [Candidatus Binatia bacterium]
MPKFQTRVFRTVRILVLLAILLAVGLTSWQTSRRIAQWDLPLRVAVHPIAGDDSDTTRRYVAALTDRTFQPVERFFDDEGSRHDVHSSFGQLVRIRKGGAVGEQPPPAPIDGNVLQIMWWSLRLRYWAWRVAPATTPAPDVTLFVVYFDPRRTESLEHSFGLEKGRIGIVNAFAADTMAGTNNVVVAHELLHTVGATDKYDPRTREPRFPGGYAQPDASPRLPQRFAEIMAGRIPVSASESTLPPSLNATLVGEATAREIGWAR